MTLKRSAMVEQLIATDERIVTDHEYAQSLLESLKISESEIKRGTVAEHCLNGVRQHVNELIATRDKPSDRTPSRELMTILRKLYSQEDMTLEFAYKVQFHAKHLSVSLCTAFQDLKAIMERHEALIRRRWARKTCTERKELLQHISPAMATKHRQDLDLVLHESLAEEKETSSLADAIMFPYINLEDLCKAHPLLIFLNARAYNLPWTFVNTENEFSPSAREPSCLGRKDENISMYFQFTKDPRPGIYGQAVIAESDEDDNRPEDDEQQTYTCQRQGLQMVYLQERIYTFLVNCCKAILHDMSEDTLTKAPVSEIQEPCMPNIHSNHGSDHKLFSDTVLLAPYRARSVIDFHRLRAYFDGFFSSAKDHVWALREDPSYLADTIRELASHQPELIKNAKGKVHWRVGKPMHTALVVREVIADAYVDLANWRSLYETTEKLCHLATGGIIQDFHQDIHVVQSLHTRAERHLRRLARCVISKAQASQPLRHLYTRQQRRGEPNPCAYGTDIKPNTTEEYLPSEIMTLLEELNGSIGCHIQGKRLFHILDRFDMILKGDPGDRSMISPLVAGYIAKLSIVAECLRQITMWYATPEVLLFQRQHIDCDEAIPSYGFVDFTNWMTHLVRYDPRIDVVDPSKGCLTYPIHHYPNRQNLEQMRKAEKNLDAFWDDLDKYFAQKTGQAQHEFIRPYVLGKLLRTPPWTANHTPDGLGQVYVPLSIHLHDTSKQITGVFDRSSESRKVKAKTQGCSDQTQTPAENTPPIPENPMRSDASDKPDVRRIDKRTLKTLKTLFGGDVCNEGDVSKTVKWDAFVRAMIRTGFSAEKLQGSAWQFTPQGNTDVERSIQFHEPHPDSDIPYRIARRFGRRLERVYGWTRDTFELS
ncbi:hypothetical protein SLS60_010869 [Paraconiothyrium brasiliense]|uniref:Uncharacterized protein n=1 Tax=Paraconiothyrium brasiliense TaxID=300254 RepID=A0ABR3QM83_9PLEO